MKIVVLILCIISCQNILPANANKKPGRLILPPIHEKQRFPPESSPSSSTTPLSTNSDSLNNVSPLDPVYVKINHELNLQYLKNADVEAFFYAVWSHKQTHLTCYQVMKKVMSGEIPYDIKKEQGKQNIFRAVITDTHGNKIISSMKYVVVSDPTASNSSKEIYEHQPDFEYIRFMISDKSYKMLAELDLKLLQLINKLHDLFSNNLKAGLTEAWIIHLEPRYYRRFIRLPDEIRERLQLYYNVLEKK